MSSFAVGGGKIDQEGFLKFLMLMFRAGYAQGLNVTQRGAGANMSVDVNISSAYGAGLMVTSANIPYFGWTDAAINTTVATADPTNPRIDTVVAYVDLSLITSSTTNNNAAFKTKAVTGTPAGSPSAPNSAAIQSSIGAGNPYITLANVAVAAAASSIVNANITDTRLPMAFQVPFLFGGGSNTKGHLVPNQTDGALITTTDTGTVTNTMLAANSAWLSWSPSWASGGSNPTLGNGTLSGYYQQIGKTVNFRINLTLGTTTVTTGATSWTFSLPVTASSNMALGTSVASWYGENPGVQGYMGVARLVSTTTIGLGYQSSTAAAMSVVGNTAPASWASTWFIRLSGSYEAA